jgi:hypothetical protein
VQINTLPQRTIKGTDGHRITFKTVQKNGENIFQTIFLNDLGQPAHFQSPTRPADAGTQGI